MRKTASYGVGGVVSADIAVPDHSRELEFYSKVLTTGTKPLWREDLTNSQGTPIIGLGERLPAYEAIPLQWMPHFQVIDVAASADRAVELGGQLLMQGACENGQSEWAVLVDPGGAAFGVIPIIAQAPLEADESANTGCIAWLSLAVEDVSKNCEFYAQVLGLVAAQTSENGKRNLQTSKGVEVAQIRPAQEDQVTSAWMIHLPVGDFAESLRRVFEHGGEILAELAEPACAIIRDPVGVFFALRQG